MALGLLSCLLLILRELPVSFLIILRVAYALRYYFTLLFYVLLMLYVYDSYDIVASILMILLRRFLMDPLNLVLMLPGSSF